eukprot:TRINITY_DN96909_c0_g1_i1.p1 TRINITY_DN96909_c0_g1~~TRINITY_DN96909_c0_g1_i1.p1  ORF type:complete len:610 (+),score=33.19 TRINITY_DN96909_c0_g1_i1:178-2007(+)
MVDLSRFCKDSVGTTTKAPWSDLLTEWLVSGRDFSVFRNLTIAMFDNGSGDTNFWGNYLLTLSRCFSPLFLFVLAFVLLPMLLWSYRKRRQFYSESIRVAPALEGSPSNQSASSIYGTDTGSSILKANSCRCCAAVCIFLCLGGISFSFLVVISGHIALSQRVKLAFCSTEDSAHLVTFGTRLYNTQEPQKAEDGTIVQPKYFRDVRRSYLRKRAHLDNIPYPGIGFIGIVPAIEKLMYINSTLERNNGRIVRLLREAKTSFNALDFSNLTKDVRQDMRFMQRVLEDQDLQKLEKKPFHWCYYCKYAPKVLAATIEYIAYNLTADFAQGKIQVINSISDAVVRLSKASEALDNAVPIDLQILRTDVYKAYGGHVSKYLDSTMATFDLIYPLIHIPPIFFQAIGWIMIFLVVASNSCFRQTKNYSTTPERLPRLPICMWICILAPLLASCMVATVMFVATATLGDTCAWLSDDMLPQLTSTILLGRTSHQVAETVAQTCLTDNGNGQLMVALDLKDQLDQQLENLGNVNQEIRSISGSIHGSDFKKVRPIFNELLAAATVNSDIVLPSITDDFAKLGSSDRLLAVTGTQNLRKNMENRSIQKNDGEAISR